MGDLRPVVARVTAIVGLTTREHAWIGGDSAYSNELGDMTILRDPKVFRLGAAGGKGGVLLGVAGSDAYADALTWLEWPQWADDMWMRASFPRAIDRALADRGAKAEDGDAAIVIALGAPPRLYILAGRIPSRPADPFGAVGSGQSPALGALWASPHAPPAWRVRTALRAAARYCASVRGPFRILSA